MYDDSDNGVDWPDVGEILLSEKDKKNLSFKELNILGLFKQEINNYENNLNHWWSGFYW